MPAALRVHNLWKSYAAGVRGCSARVWVLRGCALEIGCGERVAIVGRPGAGKTTLLRCLAGEWRVDAGRIERCAAELQFVDTGGDPSQRGPAWGTGAVLVAACDVASIRAWVDRVLLLHDGRLQPLARAVVRRVAEHSPSGRSRRESC